MARRHCEIAGFGDARPLGTGGFPGYQFGFGFVAEDPHQPTEEPAAWQVPG